ncbi:hypothetical protein PYCC9005_002530 [Savitreella phatthalungensis]
MSGGAGESALAAFQSSVAILIIIGTGFLARRHNLLDEHGESQISFLANNLFLPLLLVSEVGSNLKSSTVLSMWPLLAFAASEMVFAYVLGVAGRRFFNFPQWITPALIFNNTTSLPLLLARNLKQTGTMEQLLNGPGDDAAAALDRCETYILVSAVLHTIARFSIGPRLMRSEDEKHGIGGGEPDTAYESDGQDEETEERTALLPHHRPRHADDRWWKRVWRRTEYVRSFFNPALSGAVVAVFLGLVPFTHTAFFSSSGVFKKNLTQALKQMGDLITALLPFAVGSKLFSKPSPPAQARTWTNTFALLYLVLVRYAVIPGLCCLAVYLARSHNPEAWKKDPALDFALMISGAGPPAITLMSITEIAAASPEMIGQVARVLMVSYIFTPGLSGTVVAALAIIKKVYH